MSAVSYTHDNGIATIVLNNPPQNRLSDALVKGLTEAIADLAGRNDTRVVLFRAEGPDFSFGGDFPAWEGVAAEDFSKMIEQGLQLMDLFEALPVPIIMAVQGNCSGGGFEIALRGDIIIASDDARFSHSEASMGVFTFLGGVQRVAERVGRTRAIQWAMTCEKVGAQYAQDCGLINEVVPLADLNDAALKWAEKLGTGATRAHGAHKALLRAWASGGIEAADAIIPAMAGEILHSADLQTNLKTFIDAYRAGRERPKLEFQGK
ncbi:enoyl-CoA hydratase/isomerase family protein [uncultured Sulfitobacter sp.]|uniref:enoyl-CoA hydratase/isomerase family protein n=1 Tax=uncultured Sulfitobacter sp. TaxID=191468 RepID=UPI002622D7BD|nr:enoyl-CoA hydratase/isomerase family protein [uncultured Sulfitobacter sp.]